MSAVSGFIDRLRGAVRTAHEVKSDVFSAYPTDIDTGDGSRRESRLTRFFAIYSIAVTCLCVILASVLQSVFPLVRVQPMLLTTDSQERQIVKVEPFSQGTPGFELMTQVLCKEYVEIRNSIVRDGKVMGGRWAPNGYIWRRTSPQMYDAFAKEMRDVLKEADRRGITRSVRILADPIKVDEHFYQIEFETIDTEGTTENRQKWMASLVVDYRPQKVEFQERFMNPLGFTVTGYSVVRKVGS